GRSSCSSGGGAGSSSVARRSVRRRHYGLTVDIVGSSVFRASTRPTAGPGSGKPQEAWPLDGLRAGDPPPRPPLPHSLALGSHRPERRLTVRAHKGAIR